LGNGARTLLARAAETGDAILLNPRADKLTKTVARGWFGTDIAKT
jgi:hypothetical protein